MTGPDAQRQAIMEAVARHFEGRRGESHGGRGDHILVAGKRIALEVAFLGAKPAGLVRPRLRFDRVAQELVARMRAELAETVPDGLTVIFTITAPIRMASRTTEALGRRIGVALARRGAGSFAVTIEGNRIRVRFVKSGRGSPKVVGFVHNPIPGTDLILLYTAEALLHHIAAAASRRAPSASVKERWLVLAVENVYMPIETLRQVHPQICMHTDFARILVVHNGDSIEDLTA